MLLIVLKRPHMFQSVLFMYARPHSLLGALVLKLSEGLAFIFTQFSVSY